MGRFYFWLGVALVIVGSNGILLTILTEKPKLDAVLLFLGFIFCGFGIAQYGLERIREKK